MTMDNHGQMPMIGVPDHWTPEVDIVAIEKAAAEAALIRDEISEGARQHGSDAAMRTLEDFLFDTNHDYVGIQMHFADEDGIEERMRLIKLHETIDKRTIVFVHSQSHGRTYGIIANKAFSPRSLRGIEQEFGGDTISRMCRGLQKAIELTEMGLPANAIELDDEARAKTLAKTRAEFAA